MTETQPVPGLRELQEKLEKCGKDLHIIKCFKNAKGEDHLELKGAFYHWKEEPLSVEDAEAFMAQREPGNLVNLGILTEKSGWGVADIDGTITDPDTNKPLEMSDEAFMEKVEELAEELNGVLFPSLSNYRKGENCKPEKDWRRGWHIFFPIESFKLEQHSAINWKGLSVDTRHSIGYVCVPDFKALAESDLFERKEGIGTEQFVVENFHEEAKLPSERQAKIAIATTGTEPEDNRKLIDGETHDFRKKLRWKLIHRAKESGDTFDATWGRYVSECEQSIEISQFASVVGKDKQEFTRLWRQIVGELKPTKQGWQFGTAGGTDNIILAASKPRLWYRKSNYTNILAQGETGIVAGGGGSYKSNFLRKVITLGQHNQQFDKHDAFGEFGVAQYSSVVVTLEEGLDTAIRRLENMWLTAYDDDYMKPIPVFYQAEPCFKIVSNTLVETDMWKMLCDEILKHEPDLVAFDPIHKMFPGDNNQGHYWSELYRLIEARLVIPGNCAAVGNTHIKKSARNSDEPDVSDAIGSGYVSDGVRSVIGLTRKKGEQSADVHLTKANEGIEGPVVRFDTVEAEAEVEIKGGLTATSLELVDIVANGVPAEKGQRSKFTKEQRLEAEGIAIEMLKDGKNFYQINPELEKRGFEPPAGWMTDLSKQWGIASASQSIPHKEVAEKHEISVRQVGRYRKRFGFESARGNNQFSVKEVSE